MNFWWWFGPGYGFRITFPLPSPLQYGGFLDGHLLAFLIQSLAGFHSTSPENDRRRQGDESTTFWQRTDSYCAQIRKSGLELWITFGCDFVFGRGLCDRCGLSEHSHVFLC